VACIKCSGVNAASVPPGWPDYLTFSGDVSPEKASVCTWAWPLLSALHITASSAHGLLSLALYASCIPENAMPNTQQLAFPPSLPQAKYTTAVRSTDSARRVTADLSKYLSVQLHGLAKAQATAVQRSIVPKREGSSPQLAYRPQHANGLHCSVLRALLQLYLCPSIQLQGVAKTWLQAAMAPETLAEQPAPYAEVQERIVTGLQAALEGPVATATALTDTLTEALNACARAPLTEPWPATLPLMRLVAMVATAAASAPSLSDGAIMAPVITAAWSTCLHVLEHAQPTGDATCQDEQGGEKVLVLTEAVRLLGVLWHSGVRDGVLQECVAPVPSENEFRFLELLLAVPRAVQSLAGPLREVMRAPACRVWCWLYLLWLCVPCSHSGLARRCVWRTSWHGNVDQPPPLKGGSLAHERYSLHQASVTCASRLFAIQV
jgi:hypothetical protein